MKSVMSHNFANNPTIQAPRSSFDLSHGHKFTGNAGYLIPFMCMDVLPGDTFNVNSTCFARLSTPEFPFMDNMYIDTHYFFVAWRHVWDNSKKFFGEQDNPTDSIDYQIPQFSSFTPAESSLHDYLGLPPGNAMTPVSIYHRGYNLIWNEWFRSQLLQDSVVVDKDDGPDLDTDYSLLRRGKRFDYFTSALPSPQRGDSVFLPLGTDAPVAGLGKLNQNWGTTATVYETDGTASTGYSSSQPINGAGADTTFVVEEDPNNTGYPNIRVDLSSATAATINDLREAFQVQKLLERDNRAGTRYSELVANHFGVNFYDVSYRPEFLGGGSTPVNAKPVAVTTSVAGNTGDLGAYASAGFTGHGFTKSFVEHGFIMGLISVRADLTYQQGIHRKFLKETRYDTYFPSLAHLGEQEITNAEIYYQGSAADDLVFGYIPRYDEYRFEPSRISGQFRSSAALPLDAWHLSQEFVTLPQLGPTFIEENPPVDRIIVSAIEPHFIFDTYNQVRAARPMPVNGIPGMIDHF